jgi:hypothetical protein
MKKGRKIISLLISLAVAFTMAVLPKEPAKAFLAENAPKLNTSSEVLKLDETVPDQLDAYPDDVYGMGEEQPFLLSEQNELALIVHGAGNPSVYQMDNFNFDMTSRDQDGTTWITGPNQYNAGSVTTLSRTNTQIYDNLYYIQSVGLDQREPAVNSTSRPSVSMWIRSHW